MAAQPGPQIANQSQTESHCHLAGHLCLYNVPDLCVVALLTAEWTRLAPGCLITPHRPAPVTLSTALSGSGSVDVCEPGSGLSMLLFLPKQEYHAEAALGRGRRSQRNANPFCRRVPRGFLPAWHLPRSRRTQPRSDPQDHLRIKRTAAPAKRQGDARCRGGHGQEHR